MRVTLALGTGEPLALRDVSEAIDAIPVHAPGDALTLLAYPTAHLFDEQIVDAIAKGNADGLIWMIANDFVGGFGSFNCFFLGALNDGFEFFHQFFGGEIPGCGCGAFESGFHKILLVNWF